MSREARNDRGLWLRCRSSPPAVSVAIRTGRSKRARGRSLPAPADLVFLDSDLRVLKTMVAGRVVYRAR